jgi:hypothetical protein
MTQSTCPNTASSLFSEEASNLLNPQQAVTPDTPALVNLNSLAALNEVQQPAGVVHRHSLAEALLKPFANELFARKPANWRL